MQRKKLSGLLSGIFKRIYDQYANETPLEQSPYYSSANKTTYFGDEIIHEKSEDAGLDSGDLFGF